MDLSVLQTLNRGVSQAQRMTKLMNGNVFQTCAVVVDVLVQLPILLLVKMCVASSSRSRVKSVRQHTAGSIEVVAVTMMLSVRASSRGIKIKETRRKRKARNHSASVWLINLRGEQNLNISVGA
jgi:hypothetical protein